MTSGGTGQYVMAIDQGTTSSRAIIFNHAGEVVASDQVEHRQILSQPGWVEHDPREIWARVQQVVRGALANAGLAAAQIAALGIANQRETAVVWDITTGEPLYHAIVWQDVRTAPLCHQIAGDGGQNRYVERVGLPVSTYFSGPKVRWILDNVAGVRERAAHGRAVMGTMDSWLVWNLTGGIAGGVHVTDVTNASRTLMFDLHTLTWATDIAADIGVPVSMLPRVVSSSTGTAIGRCSAQSVLPGVPITGILGDQQAATFGQACFTPGQAKNTYGTGCFLLLNTGTTPVLSRNGLLTTVAYRLEAEPAAYALEGSVAVAGALVQWLRDNLGIISSAPEVEQLAAAVPDNGGAYIVPAFSGLFAPRWRDDARGVIVGLTRYVNRNNLARAALEATAFQTREVMDAMGLDSGVPLTELRVNGGMVANELLMQFQADILNVPVVRPRVAETTALGAAYAAGIAVGYWAGTDDIRANWRQERCWSPRMDAGERARRYHEWNKAVERTLNWVE